MSLLFHQSLVVAVLGSGSSGNCTYIGDDRHGVLIDCGLSTKQILARMATLGLQDAPISAVLITHEHSDHVGAIGVLDRKLSPTRETPLPFYMTGGTRESLDRRLIPTRMHSVTPGLSFEVGSLRIEPVSVPHDTLEPVAYVVSAGPTRAAVITDLGRPTRAVEQALSSVDLAVVEFNHDVDMLLDGSYPWQLKQRIKSHHGHLSNEQACELVANGASGRLRHLWLGHLSDENNCPDLALEAAHTAIRRAGLRQVSIAVASQTTPSQQRVSAEPEIPKVVRAKKEPPPLPPGQMPLFGGPLDESSTA